MNQKVPGTLAGILIVIFVVIGAACIRNGGDEQRKANPRIKELYACDSEYLLYTLRAFLDAGYEVFGKYRDMKVAPDEITSRIDTILYSPDRLKIFALVILGVPYPEQRFVKHPTKRILQYDGLCLIGYRNQPDDNWTIYPFTNCRPSMWLKSFQVRNLLRDYYFNDKFASNGEYIPGDSGDYELRYFKYNINEPEFWTKSIVWRKGARVPGLYNFQTRTHLPTDDQIIPPLDIEYPDSILCN